MAFFRNYLGEEVKAYGKPVFSPTLLSESDFFYKVAGRVQTDRVDQLLILYECYRKVNPKAESLDEFIFWGDVLLSDFDDTDKYLANARHLFANVSDIKAIRDNFSYLTQNQIEAIEHFVSNFGESRAIKDKFLQIWEVLLKLYEEFGDALRSRGLAYDGMVYREIADRLDSQAAVDMLAESFPGTEKFVFVGLNAPNECEKKMMRKMRDAGLAEFCWDFSSGMIRDRRNKASFFLTSNVEEFPQAFKPDTDGLPSPEFNVLSVPSGAGQAKQLPQILARLGGGNAAAAAGMRTAVVLPDQNLLMPVLNTIPEEVKKFNVTMGCPISGSGFWDLFNCAAALQMHLRLKDGKWLFYHKQVFGLLSCSIVKAVLPEKTVAALGDIRSKRRFYIAQEDILAIGDPVLDVIFQIVITDPGKASAETSTALADWFCRILETIAPLLPKEMTLELDFAKVLHEGMLHLRRHRLEILPATWFKFFSQLYGGVSVPFIGEPLNGLQIMGPLETRALDFDNVIIMSCNEGVFPHRAVSSSFIPPELRKGFGLPTYEYQDALNAYYFYRLIQRASKVWMLYDSRTEGVRGGEESRYIKQLEMHFRVPVERMVARAEIAGEAATTSIPKTEEQIAEIKKGHLSASSVQTYLSCPAKFYYNNVVGLKEEEEISESLDSGMIGNVFHNSMEELLKPFVGKTLRKADIEAMIKDKDAIGQLVRRKILDELKAFEVTGRNIILGEIIEKYIEKTLSCDLQFLKDNSSDGFAIVDIEGWGDACVDGFKFLGRLDRLDCPDRGSIRVVDYKTGRVTDDDFVINSENACQIAEKVFGPDNEDRPKIALQLYIYDIFVSRKKEASGRRVLNSIYQPARLFTKGVENVALCPEFKQAMAEGLKKTLAELADTSVPWERKGDEKTCGWCEFKTICGK